jgi:nicotinamidase-related amidase
MRTVNGVEVFDSLAEIVSPEHTALVVVDVQNDCVDPNGWFAQHGKDVTQIQGILPRVVELVEAARAAGVFVVFIEQTTLPANGSDSPAWLYFKTRDGRERTDYTLDGSWGQMTIEALKVGPDDVRVRKFRPSAFHGTSLDKILRAHGIKSVITCGVITQGCVQATTLDASFHDYYTVIARDCIGGFSPELHDNAMTFLESRYDSADVAHLTQLWSTGSTNGTEL